MGEICSIHGRNDNTISRVTWRKKDHMHGQYLDEERKTILQLRLR